MVVRENPDRKKNLTNHNNNNNRKLAINDAPKFSQNSVETINQRVTSICKYLDELLSTFQETPLDYSTEPLHSIISFFVIDKDPSYFK